MCESILNDFTFISVFDLCVRGRAVIIRCQRFSTNEYNSVIINISTNKSPSTALKNNPL